MKLNSQVVDCMDCQPKTQQALTATAEAFVLHRLEYYSQRRQAFASLRKLAKAIRASFSES